MNEDLSGLFDKLNINPNSISPDMMNTISSMVNNYNSSNNNSNNSESETSYNSEKTDNNFNMDFETIMKLKEIFDRMNSSDNDPRSNLLRALKPYLNDSRKSKVEQYIQFMKMSKVLEGFNFMNGSNQHNDGKL